jgi:hypothetical protein
MQSHKVTGLALIAGALTVIVAIALHPQHGSVESAGDSAWPNNASTNLVVIVIVLASFGMLGVGFLRLLRLTAPQPWNDVARVALVLAGVCFSLAGLIGHLVVPRLFDYVNALDNADQAIVKIVVENNLILSAALMQTSFAAWATGVLALSISMLQSSPGWKVVGTCGIALGLLILVALLLGRLQISLHGVGLAVLGSGIWVTTIGSGLAANKSFAELPPRP